MIRSATEIEQLSTETIQYLQTRPIFSSPPTKKIRTLKPEELKIFVDKVLSLLILEKNSLALIEEFGTMLPSSSFLEKSLIPDLQTALEAANQLKADAKHYLELTKSQEPNTHRAYLKCIQFLDFLILALQGLLDSIGLTDLFDNTDDPKIKAQKILTLAALILTVSSLLIPIIGLPHGLILIGSVAMVLAIGHIYPSIKPMPRRLQDTENWSRLYLEGKLLKPNPSGMNTYAIAEQLSSGRAVILQGEPGVGKTAHARLLTHEIQQGKYPHLKGKEIFYADATKFSADKLRMLAQNIERHKQNIILIFDNLDLADSNMLKQLGVLLKDTSSFPYFIGITNAQETKILPNATIVPIAKPNIRAILEQMQVVTPNIPIEETDQETDTPAQACAKFKTCVLISRSQLSPLQYRIDQIKAEISAIATRNLLNQKKETTISLERDLARLEKELENETKMKTQKQIKAANELILRKKMYEMALSLDKDSKPKEKTLFLLLQESLLQG